MFDHMTLHNVYMKRKKKRILIVYLPGLDVDVNIQHEFKAFQVKDTLSIMTKSICFGVYTPCRYSIA